MLTKKYDNIDPPSMTHAYYKQYILPESCPHIANLSTNEKRKFLLKYLICPECVETDLTADHTEETCQYTERVRNSKCRKDGCKKRSFTCPEHLQDNHQRGMKRKDDLQNLDIQYTF